MKVILWQVEVRLLEWDRGTIDAPLFGGMSWHNSWLLVYTLFPRWSPTSCPWAARRIATPGPRCCCCSSRSWSGWRRRGSGSSQGRSIPSSVRSGAWRSGPRSAASSGTSSSAWGRCSTSQNQWQMGQVMTVAWMGKCPREVTVSIMYYKIHIKNSYDKDTVIPLYELWIIILWLIT